MKNSSGISSEDALFPPHIPDYQMLGKIGGGAYGQVWMALSVTGAYRAIKIVARKDFRREETFEREFGGIKHFEPISRSHPGLVDILHVGQSHEEGFYFYVMELADDRTAEPGKIDPYGYEPRTLQADLRAGLPIDVSHSIRVGYALADALNHLHARGLSHRDVKPSNVIFVDSQPKLADIGLVAETGQQTFLGTEGFVPPEGAGSTRADIYSLGMVLYEMATGKDRLEFPELPDDLNLPSSERLWWRKLNQIICKCCAPDPKRRYATAEEVKLALDEIAQPSPNRWFSRPSPVIWISAAATIALVTFAITTSMRSGSPAEGPTPDQRANNREGPQPAQADAPTPVVARHPISIPPPPTDGPHAVAPNPTTERILASPVEDAHFYTPEGREIGPLPLPLAQVERLPFAKGKIDAPGYGERSVNIAHLPGAKPLDQPISIALSAAPKPQRGWTSPLGPVFRYDAAKRRHLSKWPIGESLFQRFHRETLSRENEVVQAEQHQPNTVVKVPAESLFPGHDSKEDYFMLMTEQMAQRLCKWIMASPDTSGTLRPDQSYHPIFKKVFAGRSYASDLNLVYLEIPSPKRRPRMPNPD